MADRGGASLFTIALNRAFADALAAGIIDRHGADPMAMARGLILLPNNRAVTAVRDAFVRIAGGALLLPRLLALGDGDLEESAGAALDRLDYAGGASGADGDNPRAPLPPPIAPMRRLFTLAQMVRDERPDLTVLESVQLATTLAQVLDQLAIEEVPFAELTSHGLDDEMASHWESASTLLSLVGREWPARLRAMGVMDRADMRNHILHRTADMWREKGLPAPFVIAAGITTSAPAVARLLSVIARAPGGHVVLPHTDINMPADEWDAL
ncbi:MAG: double-strand break repair protein AddB, partial [Sphingopyxis sp.]